MSDIRRVAWAVLEHLATPAPGFPSTTGSLRAAAPANPDLRLVVAGLVITAVIAAAALLLIVFRTRPRSAHRPGAAMSGPSVHPPPRLTRCSASMHVQGGGWSRAGLVDRTTPERRC